MVKVFCDKCRSETDYASYVDGVMVQCSVTFRKSAYMLRLHLCPSCSTDVYRFLGSPKDPCAK